MADLKYKKLLLLAMQMNDANKLTLKITQKKVINLHLFINVFIKSKLTI